MKNGKTKSCTRKEFFLSKQVVRSGTPISANVEEAIGAKSKKEFAARCQSLSVPQIPNNS